MLSTRCFSFRSTVKFLGLLLAWGVLGAAAVHSQEASSPRPVLEVDGNKVFPKQELLDVVDKCLDQSIDATHSYETEKLDYCLHKLTTYIRAKGYLQVELGKTLYNQTESVLKATIPVKEGALYRVGDIKIENAKVLSPAQLLDIIGLRTGDIADGEKISSAMFEKAKEAYGNFGYIQYTAEVTPTFHLKEKAEEGVADFLITVDEGPQFKIRSIKFTGGDSKTNELLRRELMVRDGEVYNSDLFSKSVMRMNNTGLYDRIDPDRDVEYQTNEKTASVDVTIRLKKKVATSANP